MVQQNATMIVLLSMILIVLILILIRLCMMNGGNKEKPIHQKKPFDGFKERDK